MIIKTWNSIAEFECISVGNFIMDENFENLAGKVSQSAVVKEFAGEFESFVLSTIVRSLTYDPNEPK